MRGRGARLRATARGAAPASPPRRLGGFSALEAARGPLPCAPRPRSATAGRASAPASVRRCPRRKGVARGDVACEAAASTTRGRCMRGFDPRTSFGPDVAASYDDEPRGDEEAASTFLAELAGRTGGGRALELAIGTGRIAVPLTELGRRGRRDRAVGGHGGGAGGQGLRPRRVGRRHGHGRHRADLRARLPGLQHDLQPGDPGRAGRVLRERRAPPRRGRRLRGGGGGAERVAAERLLRAAGAGGGRRRDARRLHLRPRHAGARREPRAHRRVRHALRPDLVPAGVAHRARPHGPAGRAAARRALGRVAAAALHRARPARVGLRAAHRTAAGGDRG